MGMGKQKKSDHNYNELPSDFYVPLGQSKDLSKWDDGYSLLNTNKWQVPMPRPPVCINTSPCKVCPSMESYPTPLKDFDSSRKVTNTPINKKWANDQVDSGY